VSGRTITRFFAAHAMFAPVAMIVLLSLHVFLSRVRGVGLPLGMTRKDVVDHRPFFSEFLLLDVAIWLALVGTIATLAVVLPSSVGIKADPLKPAPEGIRPEWYFLFLFQTLKVLPEAAGMALFAATAAVLLALPFMDRAASQGRRSRGWTIVFLLWLAYAAAFQALALPTPGLPSPPATRAVETFRVPRALLSLVLVWCAIGYLMFYLRQLRRENERVRRMHGGAKERTMNNGQ
jgi:cytochrome b6